MLPVGLFWSTYCYLISVLCHTTVLPLFFLGTVINLFSLENQKNTLAHFLFGEIWDCSLYL